MRDVERTCPARNDIRGRRCDRSAHHDGCHVQDNGQTLIGWWDDRARTRRGA